MTLSITAKFTGSFFKEAKNSPKIFDTEFRQAVNESILHLQSKIVPKTPVDQGFARNSITTKITGFALDLIGKVGSPLKYILPLETGRGAGKKSPPVDAIKRWVTRKGLNGIRSVQQTAYLIARAIGRKGFKGRPKGWQMFELTFKQENNKVLAFFDKARDRFVARFNK